MATTNIDTNHNVTIISYDDYEASVVYTDAEVVTLEQQIEGITGSTGSSGTSGVDGTSGTSGAGSTIVNITGETSVAINTYIRASGGTYNILLPATTGSGGTIQIKKLNAGTVTATPDGTDLIDFTANKTVTEAASLLLIDAAVGFWEIN
jgi:hypothetical protein